METVKYSFSSKGAIKWNENEDSYPGPEQHEVVEWLRVNHGIWVYIACCTKILGDKIPLYQYEIRLYGEQFVEDFSSCKWWRY